MTDARVPEKWLSDRRILRLSDARYRFYMTALVWSVSNRTDGVLVKDDLQLLPLRERDEVETHAAALVAAGLWSETEPGRWLIVDFANTQTSADELEALENQRRRDRDKKRRQRAKNNDEATVPGTVPGDSPPGRSPGTAQDRQGKDRQGQEEPPAHATTPATPPESGTDSTPAHSPTPVEHAIEWPPVRTAGGPRWKVEWCQECPDREERLRYDAEQCEPIPCWKCHKPALRAVSA